MTDPNTPPACPDWCDGPQPWPELDVTEPHWMHDYDCPRDCPEARHGDWCSVHPPVSLGTLHVKTFGPDVYIAARETVPLDGSPATLDPPETVVSLGDIDLDILAPTVDALTAAIQRIEAARERVPEANAFIATDQETN